MVQFLKNYVSPQGIETLIIIYSRTAKTWLRKLGYLYKDICRDVFVDRYERSNVVKDHANFLKKMEKFKPYMVEFFEDDMMKSKIYPSNCKVGGENRQPIIVITHDECTFFANDGVRKT